MTASPPLLMPLTGAPGAARPALSPCIPPTSSGGVHASFWEEGLVRHDEEKSPSIFYTHYCYELSLLPQRPSTTKQLLRLDVFD